MAKSRFRFDQIVLDMVSFKMSIAETIEILEKERSNTRFSDLLKICGLYFGKPRISGSHHIFKTPWPGDPRLNLQPVKRKAKPYQVDQVIAALKRLEEVKHGKSKNN